MTPSMIVRTASMARRLIAGTVASALLLTQGLFAYAGEQGFWEQRAQASRLLKDAGRSLGDGAANSPAIQLAGLPSVLPAGRQVAAGIETSWVRRTVGGASIPLSDLGPLLSAIQPDGVLSAVQHPGAGRPRVVMVRDVHAQLDAQTRIRNMIQAVAKLNPETVFLLEGASGRLPVAAWRGPDDATNEVAASLLMGGGLISGAEAGTLSSSAAVRVHGLERSDLYLANARAYLESRTSERAFLAAQAEIGERLKIISDRVLSPDLKALEAQRAGEHEGTVPLTAYALFLADHPSAPPVQEWPNFAALVDVIRREKSMDARKVDVERAVLLDRLSRSLSAAEQGRLMSLAFSFRAGQLATGDYYRALREALRGAGIDLSDYPAFGGYLEYALLADRIVPEMLYDEMDGFADRLRSLLVRDPRQSSILKAADHLDAARRLVRMEHTPSDWSRFQSEREEILGLPDRLGGLDGRPVPESLTRGFVGGVTGAERFYRAADARNEAFVANILKGVSLAKAGKSMPMVVVVAGGFHGPALEKMLARHPVTLLTVSPKLSSVEGAGAEYLGAFTREKTPLERLFLVPRLSLALGSVFGPLTEESGWRSQLARVLFPLFVLGATLGSTAPGASEGEARGRLESMGVEVSTQETGGTVELSAFLPRIGRTVEVRMGEEEKPAGSKPALLAVTAPIPTTVRVGRTTGRNKLRVLSRDVLATGKGAFKALLEVLLAIPALTGKLLRYPTMRNVGLVLLVLVVVVGIPEIAQAGDFSVPGHVIAERGDNFWSLAKQMLVQLGDTSPDKADVGRMWRLLLDANPMVNPNLIQPGQYNLPMLGDLSLDTLSGSAAFSDTTAGIDVSGPVTPDIAAPEAKFPDFEPGPEIQPMDEPWAEVSGPPVETPPSLQPDKGAAGPPPVTVTSTDWLATLLPLLARATAMLSGDPVTILMGVIVLVGAFAAFRWLWGGGMQGIGARAKAVKAPWMARLAFLTGRPLVLLKAVWFATLFLIRLVINCVPWLFAKVRQVIAPVKVVLGFSLRGASSLGDMFFSVISRVRRFVNGLTPALSGMGALGRLAPRRSLLIALDNTFNWMTIGAMAAVGIGLFLNELWPLPTGQALLEDLGSLVQEPIFWAPLGLLLLFYWHKIKPRIASRARTPASDIGQADLERESSQPLPSPHIGWAAAAAATTMAVLSPAIIAIPLISAFGQIVIRFPGAPPHELEKFVARLHRVLNVRVEDGEQNIGSVLRHFGISRRGGMNVLEGHIPFMSFEGMMQLLGDNYRFSNLLTSGDQLSLPSSRVDEDTGGVVNRLATVFIEENGSLQAGARLQGVRLIQGEIDGIDSQRLVFVSNDGFVGVHVNTLSYIAETERVRISAVRRGVPGATDWATTEDLLRLLIRKEAAIVSSMKRREGISSSELEEIEANAEQQHPFARRLGEVARYMEDPDLVVGGVGRGNWEALVDFTSERARAAARRVPGLVSSGVSEAFIDAHPATLDLDAPSEGGLTGPFTISARDGSTHRLHIHVVDGGPDHRIAQAGWLIDSGNFFLGVLRRENSDLHIVLPFQLHEMPTHIARQVYRMMWGQVRRIVDSGSAVVEPGEARESVLRSNSDHMNDIGEQVDLWAQGVRTRSLNSQHIVVTRHATPEEVAHATTFRASQTDEDEQTTGEGDVAGPVVSPGEGTVDARDPDSAPGYLGVERLADVWVVDRRENAEAMACVLTDHLRRTMDRPTVLLDGRSPYAGAMARVFAAYQVEVVWCENGSVPALAHFARSQTGRFGAVVSGGTFMDGQGRVIPPEQVGGWRRLAGAVTSVDAYEDLPRAVASGYISRVDDLDDTYTEALRSSLAASGVTLGEGSPQFLLDLRRVRPEQRAGYRSLFESLGLLAGVTDATPDEVRREVRRLNQQRRTRPGRAVIGLRVHEHGGKFSLIDTDGKEVSQDETTLLLHRALDQEGTGTRIAVTPWDPMALVEALGERAFHLTAPRPSKRYPGAAFDGDIVACAVAASSAFPEWGNRLTQVLEMNGRRPYELRSGMLRVPRHLWSLISSRFSEQEPGDLGRRLARAARVRVAASEMLPINGGGRQLFRMRTERGVVLLMWMGSRGMKIRTEDDGTRKGRGEARRLRRAARGWVARQFPSRGLVAAALGLLLLGAVYGGAVVIGVEAMMHPAWLWGIVDTILFLVENHFALAPMHGLHGMVRLLFTVMTLVLAEEVLFSVFRLWVVRRFMRGRARRYGLHPIMAEDERVVRFQVPVHWSLRSLLVQFVTGSDRLRTHEVHLALETLPPFVQAFLYARDMRISRFHHWRGRRDVTILSMFLRAILHMVFVRPVFILGAFFDLGWYLLSGGRSIARPSEGSVRTPAAGADLGETRRLGVGVIGAVDGDADPEIAGALVDSPVKFDSGPGGGVTMMVRTSPGGAEVPLRDVVGEETTGIVVFRAEAPNTTAIEVLPKNAPAFEPQLPERAAASAETDGFESDVPPADAARAWARLRSLLNGSDTVFHDPSQGRPGSLQRSGGDGSWAYYQVVWRTGATERRSLAAPNGRPIVQLALDPRLTDLPAAVAREQLQAAVNGEEPQRMREAEGAFAEVFGRGCRYEAVSGPLIHVEEPTGVMVIRSRGEALRVAQALIDSFGSAPGILICAETDAVARQIRDDVLPVFASGDGANVKFVEGTVARGDFARSPPHGRVSVHIGPGTMQVLGSNGRPLSGPARTRFESLVNGTIIEARLAPEESVSESLRENTVAWAQVGRGRAEDAPAPVSSEPPRDLRIGWGIRVATVVFFLGMAALILATVAVVFLSTALSLDIEGSLSVGVIVTMGLTFFARDVPGLVAFLSVWSPLLILTTLLYWPHARARARVLEQLQRPSGRAIEEHIGSAVEEEEGPADATGPGQIQYLRSQLRNQGATVKKYILGLTALERRVPGSVDAAEVGRWVGLLEEAVHHAGEVLSTQRTLSDITRDETAVDSQRRALLSDLTPRLPGLRAAIEALPDSDPHRSQLVARTELVASALEAPGWGTHGGGQPSGASVADPARFPEYEPFADHNPRVDPFNYHTLNLVDTMPDGTLAINRKGLGLAFGMFRKARWVRFASRLSFGVLEVDAIARWRTLLFVMVETKNDQHDRLLAHARFQPTDFLTGKRVRWFVYILLFLLRPVMAVTLVWSSLVLLMKGSASVLGRPRGRWGGRPAGLPAGVTLEMATVASPVPEPRRRRARGRVGLLLADERLVRVEGWGSTQDELANHVGPGHLVLIAREPTWEEGRGVVYVEAGRSLWRRVDSLEAPQGRAAESRFPVLLYAPEETEPSRWSRWHGSLKPRMRRAVLIASILGTIPIFAWLSFAGLPVLFWDGAAVAALLAEPGWALALQAAVPVMNMLGFLAVYLFLIYVFTTLFGADRPGAHPLKRLAAVAVAFLIFTPARVAYAYMHGAYDRLLAHRETDRSAALATIGATNTIEGLGPAAAMSLASACETVNAFRRAAGLPLLSDEDIDDLVSPLAVAISDPEQLVRATIQVAGALDKPWREAAEALKLPFRSIEDLARTHLEPSDTRALSQRPMVKDALGDFLKNSDELLRSTGRLPVADPAYAHGMAGAFEAAVWDQMGPTLARQLTAVVAELKIVATRTPALKASFEKFEESVRALGNANGRGAASDALRDVEASLNRFFMDWTNRPLLTLRRSGHAGLSRAHVVTSASNLPSRDADRENFSAADAHAVLASIEKAVLQAVADAQRTAAERGPGAEDAFRTFDQTALAEIPGRLAARFRTTILPLLENLASSSGNRHGLENVRRALAQLGGSGPAGAAQAQLRLARATEEFLRSVFSEREDLLSKVPGHLRGALPTSGTFLPRGSLVGPASGTLSGNVGGDRGLNADHLASSYRGLEQGVLKALVAHRVRLAEDVGNLAPRVMEMPIHVPGHASSVGLGLFFGAANFFLGRFGVRLDGAELTRLIMDENGDPHPLLERMAVVHYGLLVPAVAELASDRDRAALLSQMDSSFQALLANCQSSGDASSAVQVYFRGLEPVLTRLPGTLAEAGFGAGVENEGRLALLNALRMLGQAAGSSSSGNGAGGFLSFVFGRTVRDPEAVVATAQATGRAYAAVGQMLGLAAGDSPQHNFPVRRGGVLLEATGMSAIAATVVQETDRFVQNVRAQTGDPRALDGLAHTAAARFSGVGEDPRAFVRALQGFLGDLDQALVNLGRSSDSRIATGSDRRLSDLANELARLERDLDARGGSASGTAIHSVAGALASGAYVNAVLAAVGGLLSLWASDRAHSVALSPHASEAVRSAFILAYDVVTQAAGDRRAATAEGPRTAFILGGPDGVEQIGADLVAYLTQMGLRAARMARETGAPSPAGEFDSLVQECRNLTLQFQRSGGGDAGALKYVQGLQRTFNRAFALARPESSSAPTHLRLEEIMVNALNRSPFQSRSGMGSPGRPDVQQGLQQVLMAIAGAAQAHEDATPPGAERLRGLLGGSGMMEGPAAQRAFVREGTVIASQLERLVRTIYPNLSFRWQDAWGGRADSIQAGQKMFLRFVDRVLGDLARVDPSLDPGRVREEFQQAVAGSTDLAQVRERGMGPFLEFVKARLPLMPRPDALDETPSARLYRTIVDAMGKVKNPSGASAAAVRGVVAWSRALTDVHGGRPLTEKEVAGAVAARSDGDLLGAFGRLAVLMDRHARAVGAPGHVDGTFSDQMRMGVQGVPLSARGILGPYFGMMRIAVALVDRSREHAEAKADAALSGFSSDFSAESAVGALQSVTLALDRLEQLGAGGGAQEKWRGALARLRNEWPQDINRQTNLLRETWGTGVECLREAAGGVRPDYREAFPVARLRAGFIEGLKPLDREERQLISEADVQRSLRQAIDAARLAVKEVVDKEKTRQNHALTGQRAYVSVDHVFDGAGADLLMALGTSQAVLRESLSSAILLVFGEAPSARLPDVSSLKGATSEGVRSWLVDHARAYDALFSRPGSPALSLRYPPGWLCIQMESALATVERPEDAIIVGFNLLSQSVREVLNQELSARNEPMTFRPFLMGVGHLGAATSEPELHQRARAVLEPMARAVGAISEGVDADPGPLLAQVEGILSADTPSAKGTEVAQAVDAWLEKQDLGGFHVPRGALTRVAAQASVEAGSANTVAATRHILGRTLIALEDLLERAYVFNVNGLAAGSLFAGSLREGYSLQQGYTVGSVEPDGQGGVLIVCTDGTRVSLEGVPRGPDLLHRVSSWVAPGLPIVLAVRSGDAGTVAATVYLPDGGAGQPNMGGVGVYRSLNAALGAIRDTPAELTTLAAGRTHEEVLSNRLATGNRLARIAHVFAGDDPALESRLEDLAARYFGPGGEQRDLPWTWRVTRTLGFGGPPISGRQALEAGTFGEHTADYLREVMDLLQPVLESRGGTVLDVDKARAAWRLTALALTNHRDPSAAQLWNRGLGFISAQMISATHPEGGLDTAFADALGGVTRWEDWPKAHRRVVDLLVARTRELHERHGLPEKDWALVRLAGRNLAVLANPRDYETFAIRYQEWVSSLVDGLGAQAEPAEGIRRPLSNLLVGETGTQLGRTIRAHESVTRGFVVALAAAEGSFTRQSILNGSPRDAIAERLASLDDLSDEEKAALAAMGLLPTYLLKRSWRKATISLLGDLYRKVLLPTVQRSVVRYFFGLLIVGPMILCWLPALVYKAAVIRARSAEGDSDGVALPSHVRMDLRPFQSLASMSLLAVVERAPHEAAASPRVHPAFARLSEGQRSAVLLWARWEYALSRVPLVGPVLVVLIRLTEINQIILGVVLVLAPLVARTEDGPSPSWARYASPAVVFLFAVLSFVSFPAVAHAAQAWVQHGSFEWASSALVAVLLSSLLLGMVTSPTLARGRIAWPTQTGAFEPGDGQSEAKGFSGAAPDRDGALSTGSIAGGPRHWLAAAAADAISALAGGALGVLSISARDRGGRESLAQTGSAGAAAAARTRESRVGASVVAQVSAGASVSHSRPKPTRSDDTGEAPQRDEAVSRADSLSAKATGMSVVHGESGDTARSPSLRDASGAVSPDAEAIDSGGGQASNRSAGVGELAPPSKRLAARAPPSFDVPQSNGGGGGLEPDARFDGSPDRKPRSEMARREASSSQRGPEPTAEELSALGHPDLAAFGNTDLGVIMADRTLRPHRLALAAALAKDMPEAQREWFLTIMLLAPNSDITLAQGFDPNANPHLESPSSRPGAGLDPDKVAQAVVSMMATEAILHQTALLPELFRDDTRVGLAGMVQLAYLFGLSGIKLDHSRRILEALDSALNPGPVVDARRNAAYAAGAERRRNARAEPRARHAGPASTRVRVLDVTDQTGPGADSPSAVAMRSHIEGLRSDPTPSDEHTARPRELYVVRAKASPETEASLRARLGLAAADRIVFTEDRTIDPVRFIQTHALRGFFVEFLSADPGAFSIAAESIVSEEFLSRFDVSLLLPNGQSVSLCGKLSEALRGIRVIGSKA